MGLPDIGLAISGQAIVMTHQQELPVNTVQLYATAPYPCSYLPNLQARSQVATPSHLVHDDVYASLIAQGFRRSGLFTYRPHCDGCRACVPVRVLAQSFKPNRSQKRIWNKHQHLQVRVLPVSFDPDHYALYQDYQQKRHAGGGMDNDSVDQYKQFLLQSRVNTRLVEFWQPTTTERPARLVMVCIMDVLNNGLSAVYTFFDAHITSGLGTFGVLWQIEQARQVGAEHLYLGYWISQSNKMNYKRAFTPQEHYLDEIWTAA
jgi:arginyl-tRNA--protein-N-Asp/Glu arginylyltransferase